MVNDKHARSATRNLLGSPAMRVMTSALVAGVMLMVAAPAAWAARITDVADAADGDDPIDVQLDVSVEFTRHSGLITRENTQPPPNDPDGTPRTVDVKELEWERLRLRLRPRLEVGVFHDLALFTEWPVVIMDSQTTRFAEGTTSANSTIARDLAPNAVPTVDGWPETAGSGTALPEISDGRYGFPGKAYNDWAVGADGSFAGYRAGLDNPVFGLRWSPLNNERDATKPTVTLQADYTAPFFAWMDPTNDDISDVAAPGPVTDGLHKFHFGVGMSKRFGVFDPFFQLDYTLPFGGTGAANVLGHQPRQFGGFIAGSELVVFEQAQQRAVLELLGSATYFSEGRDYSEVSDLFREMTYTDQFVRLGAKGGVRYVVSDLFFIVAQGQLAYDTEHMLSIERFGNDLPSADLNNQVDLNNPAERNPYFNPAIDTVGRRLRIEQSVQLGFLVTMGVTF